MTADQRMGSRAAGYKGDGPGAPFGAGIFVVGGQQAMQGAQRVLNADQSQQPWSERFGGVSDMIRGSGTMATPILAPAILANPALWPATIGGVAAGVAGSKLAGEGAKALGASPGVVQIAEDAGGAIGGRLGSQAGDYAWSKAAKFGTDAAKKLMQSALKPGVADAPTMEDVRAIVDTALKNNIPATEAGLARTNQLISQVQQEVQAVVDAAAKAGKRVDPRAVVTRLGELRQRLAAQSTPARDLNIIDNLQNEFLQEYQTRAARPATPAQPSVVVDASGNPVMTPGQPAKPAQYRSVPADEAQARKIGTYGKAYDKDTSATYIEGQRALGRGWKEELQAIAPELQDMNASEGKLLELQQVLGRTVRREGNRDLVTGGDILAGGGGAVALGPAGGVAAAVTRRTIDSPAFKSRLALVLNKISIRSGKPVSMAESTARAAAIVTALQQAQQQDGQPAQ
jgi:hypothetical protein